MNNRFRPLCAGVATRPFLYLAAALASCLFQVLGTAPVNAATYYVATAGNDANDGLSPENAWGTMTYAAKTAVAGDTVYIRAGLYQGGPVSFFHSGTENGPIIFQGYKDSPGDTPPKYSPGDTLDSSELPVIEGSGTAIGIELRQTNSNIEIRNLGVTSFAYGILARFANHIVVDNLRVVTLNPVDSYGVFFQDSTDITIRNSVVADAATDNIILERTHSSMVENCASYSIADVPGSAATDYHIVIIDGHDNVVRDCQVHNLHPGTDDPHSGHGVGIKDKASSTGYPNPHSYNNKVIDCLAENVGEYFFVAHDAYNNEFVNCIALGRWRTQSGWGEGINIRDGAHDNTFRGCRVEGVRRSILLQDTIEGPQNPDGSPVAQTCSNNTIINGVFVDAMLGVEISNADDNRFINCVFDNVGEGTLVHFTSARVTHGNIARNAIVTNHTGPFQVWDYANGDQFAFVYSDFWNNSFGMPAGVGNLAQDPLFADVAERDYHLKSQQGRWDEASSTWVKDAVTSPCIDAGDPADDFSAEPLPNGGRINIGAYGGSSEASLGAPTCIASDECHTPGIFDRETWACSNPVKEDGAECDDGNLCSQADTCQAGVCQSGPAVSCSAADQCHQAGVCEPSSGICSNPAKRDGAACDDDSLCTQTDTCQAGVCLGADPTVCTAADGTQSTDNCDPASGQCQTSGKADEAVPASSVRSACGCQSGKGASKGSLAMALVLIGLGVWRSRLRPRVRYGRDQVSQ